jgi:tripartite-type tricarboxylate transporter receptor subunit TctC
MSKVLSVFIVAALPLAGSAPELLSQGYPNHPISLIIPMAPEMP